MNEIICNELKSPSNIDLSFQWPDVNAELCEVQLTEISEITHNDVPVEKRKRRKKKSLTGLSRKRREANARERHRVQEIKKGFFSLKTALPLPNVHISKLEIVTLAITWIDHLQTMLENYDDQRELLIIKQIETSRPEDLLNFTEDVTPVKHACLYHAFPDLQNTLWEESIGLQDTADAENEGCVHIRSTSKFNFLFE